MASKHAAHSPDTAASRNQRAARRFTLILRAGKLVTANGEFLVVLRDVSSGGIKVRLFHPLPDPGTCELELASGTRHAVRCAWQVGDHAGFQFLERPVDIQELLVEANPLPRRQIRLRLARPCPVVLHGADRSDPAQLWDISQHGAAILCETRLAIDLPVELKHVEIGAIAARVRWRRSGTYGLVFQQGFRLDALARLAARLQPGVDPAPTPQFAQGVNH